ncbi:MAG TPA: hypothetical protein VGR73_16895 [Bryobacteraceae bacterium]|nr:hypothetical protein [Bryobacteraceae bacterium]
MSIAIVGMLMVAGQAHAQGRGGPPPTAKAAAPFDVTGYWVAVVTEDWHYRMVTPRVGDYLGIPMTLESKKVADAWDPAKDEAAGEQCKSYGAAGIMRIPARLRIAWQDDNTLKMEIDAGTQTRVFHFGDWKSPGGEATWQGDSVAHWEGRRTGLDGRGLGDPRGQPQAGGLEVATTHLKAGYLRKNGVPYGANAAMTEYYDVVRERSGDLWLVLTSVVRDPLYLSEPYIVSTHYKQEAGAAGWDPTACSARW